MMAIIFSLMGCVGAILENYLLENYHLRVSKLSFVTFKIIYCDLQNHLLRVLELPLRVLELPLRVTELSTITELPPGKLNDPRFS